MYAIILCNNDGPAANYGRSDFKQKPELLTLLRRRKGCLQGYETHINTSVERWHSAIFFIL